MDVGVTLCGAVCCPLAVLSDLNHHWGNNLLVLEDGQSIEDGQNRVNLLDSFDLLSFNS